MRKVLLLAPVVLVIILVVWVKSNATSSGEVSNSEKQPLLEISNSPQTNNNEIKPETKYLIFTENVLEENINKKRVLYFYANWCPTCRPVDVEFKANENNIPEGVVVVRVNYNDSDTDSREKELAQKYGITYQHTFVEINAEGEEVQKWNGAGMEELLKRL